MGVTKGKWMIIDCDLQIVWNCILSEEHPASWSGKRSWTASMIKSFKEEGWLIYKRDFCICPNCAEAITKAPRHKEVKLPF
ncbi:MAG: hypothetical protein E3J87_03465 [Candidatus Cloacimonadota bacterium]|nr:MAG: hypothetical protein E3J87_03465 [Candidatus Cloacimonadota bacterium]